MDLSQIKAPKGSIKKIKRRGRGSGSGHGKTSCRGHKGAKSRSGTVTHMGFEGGQMPLIRRLPKRGFNPDNKVIFQVVNIKKLDTFDKDTVVDLELLRETGLIRKLESPVKILGSGGIDKPLIVKANAFSSSAKKKIEQAGGKAEIVSDHN